MVFGSEVLGQRTEMLGLRRGAPGTGPGGAVPGPTGGHRLRLRHLPRTAGEAAGEGQGLPLSSGARLGDGEEEAGMGQMEEKTVRPGDPLSKALCPRSPA